MPGQLADLVVLYADYFSIPEEEIKRLESILTLVGGKVVYGVGEFARLAPPPLPVMPEWSPVARHGGYARLDPHAGVREHSHICTFSTWDVGAIVRVNTQRWRRAVSELWELGCDCFAF